MIKVFEKYINKNHVKLPIYEIGEYVKIKYSPILDRGVVINNSKSNFIYLVERIDNSKEWYAIYQIDRKLTVKEIEDYEMKKATKKYNL